MKSLFMLMLLTTLTGCSSLSTQSNPLDPRWTSNNSGDIVAVKQHQHDEVLMRHYNVFNAPGQLASLEGFTQTSANQRAAELEKLCADSQALEQKGVAMISYKYFWGNHENHPLLSEFTIQPEVDCPSTRRSS